jgi:hypothetical protein
MSLSDSQIASAEWEHSIGLLIQSLIPSMAVLCKCDAIASFHHNFQPIEKQSSPNVMIAFLQLEMFQQIVKYLELKRIPFQYDTNIQNVLIQDQSIFVKVNVHSQLQVKEMKGVNEQFVSAKFEVPLLNMN